MLGSGRRQLTSLTGGIMMLNWSLAWNERKGWRWRLRTESRGFSWLEGPCLMTTLLQRWQSDAVSDPHKENWYRHDGLVELRPRYLQRAVDVLSTWVSSYTCWKCLDVIYNLPVVLKTIYQGSKYCDLHLVHEQTMGWTNDKTGSISHQLNLKSRFPAF